MAAAPGRARSRPPHPDPDLAVFAASSVPAMRIPTRHLVSIVVVPLLVVSFAACDGDGGSAENSSGSDEATWRPESDVPTEPGQDGLTQPGAVLKVGETAHVTYEDEFSDVPSAMEFDVTASAEVTKVDVEDLPEDQRDKGTPYFVPVEVSSTDAGPGSILIPLDAVDGTGDDMDRWGSTSFEECSGEFIGGSGDDPAEVCGVVFGDSAPVAVAWENSEVYDDDPVLWDLGS